MTHAPLASGPNRVPSAIAHPDASAQATTGSTDGPGPAAVRGPHGRRCHVTAAAAVQVDRCLRRALTRRRGQCRPPPCARPAGPGCTHAVPRGPSAWFRSSGACPPPAGEARCRGCVPAVGAAEGLARRNAVRRAGRLRGAVRRCEPTRPGLCRAARATTGCTYVDQPFHGARNPGPSALTRPADNA